MKNTITAPMAEVRIMHAHGLRALHETPHSCPPIVTQALHPCQWQRVMVLQQGPSEQLCAWERSPANSMRSK